MLLSVSCFQAFAKIAFLVTAEAEGVLNMQI